AAAGFLASVVATWLRVPALVLFLGLGMAIGSDGTGWIDFESHEAARFIGVVALALILFDGGLAAGWHELRPVIRPSIILAFVATIVTPGVTGLVAVWLFKLAGPEVVLHGSGFLAVFLSGLVVESADIPARRAVFAFHEGLASVAEIGMFFALGLLVFPSELGSVAIRGTVLALVVAFLARPVAAFLATAMEHFSHRERLVLGWAGLRGAVPVVLATFPVIADIPRSMEFFNIVFFAVLVSTLIQGATVEPLARGLGVIRAGESD